MEKIEKISLDDIVNLDEIPTLKNAECCIDNMISFNPLINSECEHVFCPDCITNWKNKKGECPECRKPLNLSTLDKNVLKLQINKIKIACSNYQYGCLTKVLVTEKMKHENNCEYRKVKCQKCQEEVPMILQLEHSYKTCAKNKINCFVCSHPFSVMEISSHLDVCFSNYKSLVCQKCFNFIVEDMNTHMLKCNLELKICKNCQLPDLSMDLFNGSHKCLHFENPEMERYNLTTYLKNVDNKFNREYSMIINRQDEKNKEFDIRKKELFAEITRNENLRIDYNMVMTGQSNLQKLEAKKKEKREANQRLENDIEEIKSHIKIIENKIKNNNQMYERHVNCKKAEFNLKIIETERSLYHLRTLSNLTKSELHHEESNNKKKEVSQQMIKINNNCKMCQKEIQRGEIKCGGCGNTICQSCVMSCPNRHDNHPVNTFCNKCFSRCSVCRENLQCKVCIRKCFSSSCNNELCNKCYERNKHQLRSETTNCKFYKCESCNFDQNCIMTTIYCSNCDIRICTKCYHSNHKHSK